ncbi:hypothetical protein AAU61_19125 [Desulfocarbo indianensis]|nr:hypothetical protein AAU61_19125 [Desulfocarbo indianensis]
MPKWVAAWLVLAAFSAAGCAASRMQEAYKNPQYLGGVIKSVLVVGVAKKIETRKSFESHFAKALSKAGLRAVPSHEKAPRLKQADAQVIRQTAAALGLQAVMVVHYRGAEREFQTPQGPTPGLDYNSLPYYFPGVYNYVNRPDYAPMKSYLQLECNLYEVKSLDLVWTGHSEILEPRDLGELSADLAGLVTAQLKKDGLLP